MMLAHLVAIDPDVDYEAEEVALLVFRCSLRSFNRHRRRRRAEGFPEPVSRWGKKVWSGADLIAWRNRDKSAIPAAGGTVVSLSDKLAEAARQAARNGAKGRL